MHIILKMNDDLDPTPPTFTQDLEEPLLLDRANSFIDTTSQAAFSQHAYLHRPGTQSARKKPSPASQLLRISQSSLNFNRTSASRGESRGSRIKIGEYIRTIGLNRKSIGSSVDLTAAAGDDEKSVCKVVEEVPIDFKQREQKKEAILQKLAKYLQSGDISKGELPRVEEGKRSMNLGLRKKTVLKIHKENKRIVSRLEGIQSEMSKLSRSTSQVSTTNTQSTTKPLPMGKIRLILNSNLLTQRGSIENAIKKNTLLPLIEGRSEGKLTQNQSLNNFPSTKMQPQPSPLENSLIKQMSNITTNQKIQPLIDHQQVTERLYRPKGKGLAKNKSTLLLNSDLRQLDLEQYPESKAQEIINFEQGGGIFSSHRMFPKVEHLSLAPVSLKKFINNPYEIKARLGARLFEEKVDKQYLQFQQRQQLRQTLTNKFVGDSKLKQRAIQDFLASKEY
ncbi:hypothetical protein FGO68_gene12732 [Halteria grandinella]|uniref:Uncharacterized protein n=1 Tax=Halteria grandinella TaxID=5974 RepID=A0A8J8NNA9_HALGN|nr:hypothetical protein FGO68_gene12732 [Halteria grandinella]